MALSKLAEYAKAGLEIPDIRCYGTGQEIISRVAISGGSGKGVIQNAIAAGAEALITGDIDYHSAIDALACGLHILDAGHYGTEYGFISHLTERLKQWFPSCQVKGAAVRFPFQVF